MTDTLYVNGCSWCQGYLLQEEPRVISYAESLGYEFLSDGRAMQHGKFISDAFQSLYDEFNWAGVLQKQLGIPKLVNQSLGAGSNSRVLRTTLDYVKTLTADERSRLFVIIGWTLPDRNELYLDDRAGTRRWELFNAAQPWNTLTPDTIYTPEFRQRMTDYWRRHVADVHNGYASVKQFFQQSYLLANTLENLGIRYYFFNTFSPLWGIDNAKDMDSLSTDMEHYQRHSAMSPTDTFAELISDRPDHKLSDGHPNSVGYKLWADKLYVEITRLGLV